tara:strand:- start:8290 stop:9543 length:1254 start_codon:yes stop_codon:yes gene_type:complete
MSARGFAGAAGTGKTTRLMAALEEALRERPLREGERILALTRMHGSRFRLIDKLGAGTGRGRFDCLTFDRFAWELSSRWRSRARELAAPTSECDYDATCAMAHGLLCEPSIARWVCARYPIVIVDELQDCRDGRLGIVQALCDHSNLLVAGDDFQDLGGTGQNPAMEWLASATLIEELAVVHRTSNRGLLQVASAFRDGTPVPNTNSKVLSAPNHNVAASFLANGIQWSGGDEIVVLSASRSPFVMKALTRLAEKPIGKKEIGPYRVSWEQSRDSLEQRLCEALSLSDDDSATVDAPRFAGDERLPAQKEIENWIRRRRRVHGQVSFRCEELRSHVRRSVDRLRAQPSRSRGPRVMTIHQAKNREFDRVLILWPLRVVGGAEAQRRLLYNAVTRAKKQATIIVQDPKRDRLATSPFQ